MFDSYLGHHLVASYNGSIAGAEPENGGSIPHAATFALIAQLVEHLHPCYTGNVRRHWFESSYRHQSDIGGL